MTHELAEVEIVVEKPVEKAAEVAVDKVAYTAAEGVEEMTRQKMGEQVVWLEVRLSEVVRGWMGQLRLTGRLRWTRTI